MENREIKALQIAATMPIKRDAAGWRVPSQSNNGNYKVRPTNPDFPRIDRVGPWECNCPDFELRGLPCKHIMAVEFTIRREVIDDGGSVTVTETETVKITYTQDWAAYNRGQCEEGERFFPMLADLCSTIENAPQGKGRPRLPMSDMAFASVSKVYSGRSARRHDSDVREAQEKGLTETDPHFNSVLRYLRDPEMTPVLQRLVELSALPLKAVEQDFAVDSTGFSTCRFVRWFDHKWGKEQTKREWIKLHAMTGVYTNIVTAVEVSPWRSHDTNYFRPMLATTAQNFDLGNVTADKAYLGRKNLQAVVDAGGTPYVPFKGDQPVFVHYPMPSVEASAWDRMFHLFAFHRETFMARYHQRSNVECTFSMIKRKFGDSVRAKCEVGQMNEALCKVIAHNLCVLISAIHEIQIPVPEFAPLVGSAG